MDSSSSAPPTNVAYKQELDRALNPLGNISMTIATSGLTVTVFAFAPVAIGIAGSMSLWIFLLAAVLCVCQGLA